MTTRKDFLAASAAIAAAPVAASAVAASPAPKPSSTPDYPKLDFDVAAFAGVLDREVPHKHLFVAKAASDGLVFDNMRATLHAYKEIGTAFAEIALAAVLYHDAMVFGLDDAMWSEYLIPLTKRLPRAQFAAMKDVTSLAAGAKGNPAMKKDAGEWDASIPGLISDAGARFFVCNNAAMGLATAVAKTLKRDRLAVYHDMRSHLIPNAMLVPAGVWAVHAVQERNYTLLQSS